MFLSFVVMNEERFILAWDTPFPDAAFKLTIYQFGFLIFPLLYKSNRILGCLRRMDEFQFLMFPEQFHIQVAVLLDPVLVDFYRQRPHQPQATL